jgi:hypothetical protein
MAYIYDSYDLSMSAKKKWHIKTWMQARSLASNGSCCSMYTWPISVHTHIILPRQGVAVIAEGYWLVYQIKPVVG